MSFGTLPRNASSKLNLRRASVAYRKTLDVQSTVRKIPGHKCSLPNSEEQINYVISNGFFVLLRRKIRKWLTVNPSDPYSKRILRSSAQIHREETRHLTRHLHMIHPFSKGRFFWEMLMIPVLFTLFVLIPLEVSTDKIPMIPKFCKLILDMVSFIDIILFFFTGYYDVRIQAVVMDAKHVAKRYLFSLFLFDVVSSLPYTFILETFISKAARRHRRLYYLKLFMLLKLVRMPTLTRYMRKFSERKNFLSSYIKFVIFILWVLVLSVWTSAVIFGVRVHVNSKMFNDDDIVIVRSPRASVPMTMIYYDVVRTFLMAGTINDENLSNFTMILQIIALLFGSALNMVILATVMQVFQRRVSSRDENASLIDQLDEYMKYKELPTRLKEKVFNYVDFKFKRHIFREDEILHTLSPILKRDILMHTCHTMIQAVDFFKDLPTTVMLRLVTKLHSEIYLPNDVIVMAGYAGNAMYFIYTGTVTIYTKNGKEICHLDDGSHFGEIALVYNEPRVATVVALRECEVFKLSRKDFQEAIEPFPELNKKIREQALTRMEKTLKMTQDTNKSLLTHDENIGDVIYTPIGSTISIASNQTQE